MCEGLSGKGIKLGLIPLAFNCMDYEAIVPPAKEDTYPLRRNISAEQELSETIFKIS